MYIKNPLIDKTRGSVDFSWQCLGLSNLLLSEKKKMPILFYDPFKKIY